MAFRIPITADVDEFYQVVELDGSSYTLTFSYSERASLWCLSIFFIDNGVLVPVLEGVALVANWPILAGVTHANRPKGELAIRATRDPSRSELGASADLIYWEASEL